MIRDPASAACKICTKPFCVFRWHTKQQHRITEICQLCARSKHLCQACVLDLSFHIRKEVRDEALGVKEEMPGDERNRAFYMAQLEQKRDGGGHALDMKRKVENAGRDFIKKLRAETQENTEKTEKKADDKEKEDSRPLCLLFAKGECTRGDRCVYRHILTDVAQPEITLQYGRGGTVHTELAVEDDNQDVQHEKDASLSLSTHPQQLSTSLFIINVPPSILEQELKQVFGEYGQVESVVVVREKGCGFVHFASRAEAEYAMRMARTGVVVDQGKVRLRVVWAKPKPPVSPSPSSSGNNKA